MATIVQNRIFMISWDPGSGKSWMGAMIASSYDYIYSNIDIKKNWKTINTRLIKDLSDIENISYKEKKWIVMVDEGWVNINSRKFMTDQNILFWQLGMLWRKKNVDICIITQRDFMVDKNFRELAKYVFEMRSYFVGPEKLMFEFKVFSHGVYKKSWKIDLMEWSNRTWFTYDSLDSARIT